MKLSSLAEENHFKKQEVSQNSYLDMQEFLGVSSALLPIQSELASNTSKLTEISESRKKDKKLKEVEDHPTYFEVQRKLYEDRLEG